jgi:hypothetical protein
MLVIGAQKHFAPTASFTLAGRTYTLAQLVQFCTDDIAACDGSVQAKAAWLTAVQAERSRHHDAEPILRAFKAYVTSFYGDSPTAGDVLGDFGLSPRKVPVKDVAVKSVAVEKMLATRKARHTLGKVQKKGIKGTIQPGAPTSPSGSASISAHSEERSSTSPSQPGTDSTTPSLAPRART